MLKANEEIRANQEIEEAISNAELTSEPSVEDSSDPSL